MRSGKNKDRTHLKSHIGHKCDACKRRFRSEQGIVRLYDINRDCQVFYHTKCYQEVFHVE